MTGRPSLYSPELAETICSRMAAGETVRAICRDDGMPTEATVRNWVVMNREGFFEPYARARKLQAQAIAEQAYHDGIEAKDAQLGRLKMDAGKWFASKLDPRYGESLAVTGADGGPIKTEEVGSTELARRLAFLLAKGDAGA